MKPQTRRKLWLPAALLAIGMVAAACSSSDDSSSAAVDGESASAVPDCLDNEAIYALVGPESTGFSTWSDATSLAQELGSEHADFPDSELVITAPGEESGTYDTFVEFAIEEIAEERGQDAATRPDYVASPNDNIIIEGIEGAPASFGWVGYAFFVENKDRVKAISIAGEDGTCVAPDDDTIASGDYPYSRPLYIYVNKEKAEDSNSVVADFVDFYLSDTGYDSVSEAGYVQLAQDEWDKTVDQWNAEGGEVSDASGNQIEVSGSSTVEPITSLVAEKYNEQNPDVGITVEGPGTGDGFQRFCSNETDISDASRAIKEEEIADCEANGVEYIELKIAIDGLSVLTSK